MSWVRLDDAFGNHPKLAKLGADMLPCVGLHVLALCYCSTYLTDGRVPFAQIARLAGDVSVLLPTGDPFVLVAKLVSARLWHDRKTHYLIHDYLKYNPSRAQVLEARRNKVLAGQAGGQASAQARAQAEGQAEVNGRPSRRASKTQAEFNSHTRTPSPGVLRKNSSPPTSPPDEAGDADRIEGRTDADRIAQGRRVAFEKLVADASRSMGFQP